MEYIPYKILEIHQWSWYKRLLLHSYHLYLNANYMILLIG